MNEEFTISLKDAVSALLEGIPDKYTLYCENTLDNKVLDSRLPKVYYITDLLIDSMISIAKEYREADGYHLKDCGEYCENALYNICEHILFNLSLKHGKEIVDSYF